jgi:lipopolysaccharide biosynthesis protein
MLTLLVRAARLVQHLFLTRVMSRVALLASLLSRPNQAVSTWPAPDAALGADVAIFVHFDRAGAVRPYVLNYLASLQAAGLSIVFVTNSGRLQADALAALQALCAGVLVRRNVGYDFAAMREAMEHFSLPRANTRMLLLANDSVYGPLRPLGDVMARLDFTAADLWGATESWQHRYHLQSYFMAIGRAALSHPAWPAFWRRVRPVNSKHWVISRYEVGLSQAMLRAGLRCAALWPYHDIVRLVDQVPLNEEDEADERFLDPMERARRKAASRISLSAVARRPLNPTADLWRQLLKAGFPFLKRELLRENPAKVPDVTDWREVAQQTLGADISLIELDLQRVMRNRAP